MKRIVENFMYLLFTIVIFSAVVFSQSKTETTQEKLESPYGEVNLKFILGADPTLEDVGFDEPKSYWKFSYELRFLENEKSALDKSGYKHRRENQNENAVQRAKGIERNNRHYAGAWKKLGTRVAKGKIMKTSLLSEENRGIIIPVQLDSEVRNILARADGTNDIPSFRIQIKGKIYSKTKSNLKFKQKFSHSYTCPTKMIVKDTAAWMMNTCGIYLGITNQNNKIQIGSTSRL